MYIVDRVEENYVILEHTGKIIELKKNKLPNVLENDILYLKNGSYIKDNNKTIEVKKNTKERFNRLKR